MEDHTATDLSQEELVVSSLYTTTVIRLFGLWRAKAENAVLHLKRFRIRLTLP